MQVFSDPVLTRVLIGLALALTAATLTGRALQRRATTAAHRAAMENLNARITAWWPICGVVLGSVLGGTIGIVVLFALLSLLALREFVTLMPPHRADHRVLLVAFFIAVPLQYTLVAVEEYGSFAVVLPVAGLLCMPAYAALTGDTDAFTDRAARIQWGLILCVYALSCAPALLMLHIPGYAGQNAKLLVFLLIVVESSDVFQYIWGKLCGRHSIAPRVSPSKTVEGFVGGLASATLLGAALYALTPFRPVQAAAFSLAVTVAGFFGGLVMSAMKRDRGVKDFGTTIAGHGGILDRIDSLCFAAPVFFHMTRHFFAA